MLSPGDLDALADKAERGLDLSTWKPRRGRPPLGAEHGQPSPRIAVRLPRSLYDRVADRATRERKSMSEVVRDLLAVYVADANAAAPTGVPSPAAGPRDETGVRARAPRAQ